MHSIISYILSKEFYQNMHSQYLHKKNFIKKQAEDVVASDEARRNC
jgi:hypothetical protein